MSAFNKPQAKRAASVTRVVLACNAIAIAITVPLLLLAPQILAEWLGLTNVTADTRWVLQIVGAGSIALAGQTWLVRRSADAHVFNSAAMMLIKYSVLSLLVAVMSGDWTTLRWVFLLMSAFFAVVYAGVLLWSQRGENPSSTPVT